MCSNCDASSIRVRKDCWRDLTISYVVAVTLILAGRLFRLTWRYAVNIFFSDQWDTADATLFQKHTLWEMFSYQHGPHRQGLGSLLEKLVDPFFAWNSRIESFVVWGIIVVAGVCALLLKRRLFGPFSVFDIVIPALFFNPGQFETIFVTINYAHGPLPLLLVMLYLLAWTIESHAVRYPLILLINFVTIYTGFGLFLGVITPLLLALDYFTAPRNVRLVKAYFIGAIILAIASLASFFVGYKFNPAIACFSVRPLSPRSYVAYMAIMLVHFFTVDDLGRVAIITGIAILGAISAVLVFSVLRLVRQRATLSQSQRNAALVTATLAAYCLLFLVNTSYGRTCAGLETARSSRYVIYLETGVLGLYFCFLSLRRTWVRGSLIVALLVPSLIASWTVDRFDISALHFVKQEWRACYLKTEDPDHCEQVAGPFLSFLGPRAPILEKLRFLKKRKLNLYSDSAP